MSAPHLENRLRFIHAILYKYTASSDDVQIILLLVLTESCPFVDPFLHEHLSKYIMEVLVIDLVLICCVSFHTRNLHARILPRSDAQGGSC